MLFCDLVIECMQQPEQVQGLCCLPIQIKRKWYPLILIAIFSLLFFQLSMWVGLGVGYLYHYGFFKRVDMGAARATSIEKKWPFKIFAERPYFITAGSAMGGEVLPGFIMNRGSAQESNADNESAAATAASNNSQAANFKAFSGKGQSIGGAPVSAAPPRFDSRGASASRGRSTPETRAAAEAAAA